MAPAGDIRAPPGTCSNLNKCMFHIDCHFLRPTNSELLNDVSYAEAEFGDYMDYTDGDDEETSTPDADIPGLERVLSFSDHELVTGDETFICFLQQLQTLANACIPELCSVTDCRQPIRISRETIWIRFVSKVFFA